MNPAAPDAGKAAFLEDQPMCECCKPLFPFGRVLITPNADRALTQSDVYDALGRHRRGDWGDVCEADRAANDEALHSGGRLLSVYHGANDTKFWIITEADRSATTVLLPGDY